ncbi:hypothetical protein XFF6166_110004 [Xanthomonas citri pv. fuscans]|nr:hypothetical protein XFF6166_110004 [Xanthomonas citri pv. fuscans]SOO03965.1 hypothetical protein XFF6960_90053 [Xanthomonas citri pv. fuscans]SOO04706.1 hypothetical protein XFF7767_280054 [Xanthomonas citri pv. fuscans]SOO08155.1 hypothetical protein XFF6970_160001 [Xanthomonas citri pv. fuscans]SOO16838.1 hypothetical protein XFF7766_890032 [Xanthomonas citri pv. fuscans]
MRPATSQGKAIATRVTGRYAATGLPTQSSNPMNLKRYFHGVTRVTAVTLKNSKSGNKIS